MNENISRKDAKARKEELRNYPGIAVAETRQVMIYRDRIDAGKQLAARLTDYADRDDVLVLALPRGGVPVAFEVEGLARAARHLPG